MLLQETGTEHYSIKGQSGISLLNLEPEKRHILGLKEAALSICAVSELTGCPLCPHCPAPVYSRAPVFLAGAAHE